jgi:hypothetical protein
MTMRLIVQQAQGTVQTLRLDRGLLTVGRGQDCDLVLPDTQVSRHHAELRRQGDQWLVVDLGSTNGTFVGGARLRPNEACPLLPGIPAQVGDIQLTLEEEPSQPAASQGVSMPGRAPQGMRTPGMEVESVVSGGGNRTSRGLVGLARAAVVVGGALLIIGSLLPWIRVEVTLPLVGRILDQVFDGLDSGQAGLFIGMAVMALLLVVVDAAIRRERSRLLSIAVGLGQVAAGIVAVVAAGADVYRYYELGIQEFLGISLIDILSEHVGKEILIFIQLGVYLAAVGLVILILGGLLRLFLAARA